MYREEVWLEGEGFRVWDLELRYKCKVYNVIMPLLGWYPVMMSIEEGEKLQKFFQKIGFKNLAFMLFFC